MGSWIGLLTAGILNGSFAVPMKRARAWKFFHVWGIFALMAMMVVPCAGVMLAVPGWAEIVGDIPLGGLSQLIVLGAAWGAASLLYGVALEVLGVALGLSIVSGLSIVIGAVAPRVLSGDVMTTPTRDVVFCLGLLLMVAGVVVCARAGSAESDKRSALQFRRGLLIAVLSGIGLPLLNIGIELGISLLQSMPHVTSAANPSLTHWVAWAVFLFAAAIVQSGYCISHVFLSGKQGAYAAPGALADCGRVVVMTVAWSGSIFLYGWAVAGMGSRGFSVGWPVFIALIIVTSNAWGVWLGEWRDRPRALQQMLRGCALIIGAAFVIARVG